MPITISAPAPPPPINYDAYSNDEDEMELDSDEETDVGEQAYKKPRVSAKHVITPGELVTDDTQWMRWGFTATRSVRKCMLISVQRTWHILSTRFDRNSLLNLWHDTQDKQIAIMYSSSCPLFTRNW
jgi:exosome complex component RRP4